MKEKLKTAISCFMKNNLFSSKEQKKKQFLIANIFFSFISSRVQKIILDYNCKISIKYIDFHGPLYVLGLVHIWIKSLRDQGILWC